MRKVIVERGQTVWDVALRYMGSVESVFDILELNPGLRPDKEFKQTQGVYVPEKPTKHLVVAYYESNKIDPRTGEEDT